MPEIRLECAAAPQLDRLDVAKSRDHRVLHEIAGVHDGPVGIGQPPVCPPLENRHLPVEHGVERTVLAALDLLDEVDCGICQLSRGRTERWRADPTVVGTLSCDRSGETHTVSSFFSTRLCPRSGL